MERLDKTYQGPFDKTQLEKLSAPHKTIREPVHGDVLVNHLEVSIIDTKQFQRLRYHKQLGLCYMVYPGAEHSRFQHVVGTLHVATRMLDSVNSNAKRYRDPPGLWVPEYGRLLTRLAALLHDVANIPFGHTLEDEGLLVRKDWSDLDRTEIIFAKGGFLEQALSKSIEETLGLRDLPVINRMVEVVLRDLRSILTDGGKADFPFAYAADIVGNTFCADLLDYLERDAYFAGIQGKFRTDRSRAISYLFIPLSGDDKNRLVVRLWHKDRFKDDVISELFNVLRARKDLAEAVYFHHSKECLSAMLIAAAQRSNLIDRIKKDKSKLLEITDHQIFAGLESDEAGSLAKKLSADILQRKLYVPVYLVSKLTTPDRQEGALDFKNIAEKMRNRSNWDNSDQNRPKQESADGAQFRMKVEDELSDLCNLDPGQVIIYCPDTEMNLKAAKARILWERNHVAVLEKVPSGDIEERIDIMRVEHQALWKFYIFADRDLAESQRKLLAAACFDRFHRENEMVPYKDCKNARNLSVDLWASERSDKTIQEVELLKNALLQPTRDKKFTDFLSQIGYSDKKLPASKIYDEIWKFQKEKLGD